MNLGKHLAVAAAIGLTTASAPALAQSTFSGFYGHIATGYEHNSTDAFSLVGTATGGTPNTSTSATLSSKGMPAVVGVGYTFDLQDGFTLGLGLDYSALTKATDAAGFSYPTTSSTASYDYQIAMSDRLSVSLSPGYVIDDRRLAYLKLGYASQRLQYRQTNCCSTPSNKGSVNGYLVGIGYKQMISSLPSNGLYGFVEANYQNYSKANLSSTYTDGSGGTVSAKPASDAYNFLVGVGYTF